MRRFLLPFALLLSVSLAAQVPPHIPTNGLVAWYGLESDALDGSGNGNNLTTAGNPQWLSSDGQGYADLDGNGDFFFNDDPSFPVLNEIFVSCWVRIDAFGSGGGSNLKPIISKWNSSGAGENSFIVCERDNNISWVTEDGSNTNPTFNYAHNWPAGEWHHIGAYYGDSLKLFIDGNCVSEGINVSQYDNSNSNFRIGDWYSSISSNYSTLDGGIRSVGIWNRGLSALEAQALFTEIPPVAGCMEENACNYNTEADLDNGSCIPSGCMEEGACNYNAAAECEGEACDYSCCPGPGCCGAGTHWDTALATCVVEVPDTVDAACTLMTLQELASGYAALVEQNAALDSLLSACEGDGSTNASGPCAGQDHVTYHSYDYTIVEIGDQCWFSENLRNEAFDDGTPIVLSNSDGDWTANASGPQRCAMNFSSSDADLYGYLYNFASVTSVSGLCPSGFHVPTDSEFVTMEVFLGMPASESYDTQRRGEAQGVGDKMKDDVLMTGNNSSGFTALPGGLKRATVNGFNYYQQDGYWWTSSSANTDNAWYRGLSNLHPATYRRDYPKGTGFSVRCVKN